MHLQYGEIAPKRDNAVCQEVFACDFKYTKFGNADTPIEIIYLKNLRLNINLNFYEIFKNRFEALIEQIHIHRN